MKPLQKEIAIDIRQFGQDVEEDLYDWFNEACDGSTMAWVEVGNEESHLFSCLHQTVKDVLMKEFSKGETVILYHS